MDLLELLQQKVVVADGAYGTLLTARGIAYSHPYDYANLTHADDVRDLQAEYVAAGAQLIETNTYGANRFKLAAFELDSRVADMNEAGARIAHQAAAGKALVAGAVGPCGKPLAPIGRILPEDARASFRQQIEVLAGSGVDLLILETFSDLPELEIAVQVAREVAPNLPIIAHKTFIEDGETLAEGLPRRVAETVHSWGVDVVGSNCTAGPQRMLGIIQQMAAAPDVRVSAMPTAGMPQIVGGHITYSLTPDYFAYSGRLIAEAGANIVGGCCGTTPAHIKALAEAVAGMKPVSRARGAAAVTERAVEAAAVPAVEVDERSAFARKLGQKYVVAVELDLPRGTDISRAQESAAILQDAGCDCIDIADGARARLRMNPMVAGHVIQSRVGIDVMMHFCCRDRNMLAIQADLLGCHALGVRNILAITGDPAQIGDYPTASSVFDIDSIGLVRILRLFNEGKDLGGNSIAGHASFLIAVAYNPLAPDQNLERERLARKADEGAQLVYTQPIFLPEVLDRAVEDVSRHGLPLLVGVLPLRSTRHAEFMQNEVPGVSIPDDIRARIAQLSDADARKFGVDVAREFVRKARPMTQGVYLMPPFGNPKTAVDVMEALEGLPEDL